jgi:gas vesicle structural protein
MTVMPHQGSGGVGRGHSSSLYDVLELILDKGLVIDAYIRVSLVGIELLTIDIRVVIASVDTYLRFAEAVNRLDLSEKQPKQLPEFVGELSEQGASGKTKGALSGAAETFTEAFRKGRGGREDQDEREREQVPHPRGRERSKRRDD